MWRRSKRITAILALCAASGVGTAHLYATYTPPRAVAAAGITLPVHNELAFYQALDVIEKNTLGQPVQLVAQDNTWTVVGYALGVRLDRPAMWKDATERRPNESIWAFFVRTRLHRQQPRQLDIRLTYDNARLDAYLSQLGASIWRTPRNARINSDGTIAAESPGRSLNVPATRHRLLDAWRQGQRQVMAVVNQITPATTKAMLAQSGVRYMIGRFSTYFDSQKAGRVENIRTAAQFLDGVVIAPGQVFSFNNTVGPRTLERGFEVAEEIVNQELVPGVGGGVCQVSSTLYNAVLLSGLEITERRNHSRPLGYVAIGRDATVYYGAIDFRFRNPFTYPLVLSTEVVGNRLSVAVYAPQKPSIQYEIEVTDVIEVAPSEKVVAAASVPPGQNVVQTPGEVGWKARTWRIVKTLDGKELARQQISSDNYPARPTIIQVNPGLVRPGAALVPASPQAAVMPDTAQPQAPPTPLPVGTRPTTERSAIGQLFHSLLTPQQ